MILKEYKAYLGFEINNYLLIDEENKEAVLVDCTGNFNEIEKELENYGAKLKYILLTHGHFDHIYGCQEFKEKLNPTIVINVEDKILIDNLDNQCNLFEVQMPQQPMVDDYIDENSNLSFGKYKINVIHTPGHTKGSVCYLIDNILFSGDTLFYESVGRCDLPGGNFNEIEKSIKDKLFILNPKTKVYTGHGPTTLIEHEIKNNCYVH